MGVKNFLEHNSPAGRRNYAKWSKPYTLTRLAWVRDNIEPVPFLLSICRGPRWRALEELYPPLAGNIRYFKGTGYRLVVLQPVVPPGSTPEEFVKQVQPLSKAFAARHGFALRITADSWHAPGAAILIEYRAKKEEKFRKRFKNKNGRIKSSGRLALGCERKRVVFVG